MGRINVLDTKTANAIKAGEVIDRPVSVVKELFDNSIDGCASHIKIEFANGGITLIRVTDDGCGMDSDDAKKAFLIHATSKLHQIDDLYSLSTMGFRGEALASIAACSDVTLTTCQAGETGTRVVYEDGEYQECEPCNAPTGTCVEVKRLFANFPARYKFLKKDSTEGMYITSLIEKLAITNPSVSVKLIKDGAVLFTTPGTGEMLDAIYAVYGKEVAKSLVEVDYSYESYKLSGFAGKPAFVRGNRGMQSVCVNNLLIHSKTISAAIDEAYKNSVMKNKFPVCFLDITCAPGSVDVNVHPQKAEVRFSNDSDVFRLIYHGLKDCVIDAGEAGNGFLNFADNTNSSDNYVDESAGVLETNTTSSGTQLQMEFHKMSKPISSSSYSAGAVNANTEGNVAYANKLLGKLSEFKPDISAVTENNSSEILPQVISENIAVISDGTNEPASDIQLLADADFVGFLFTTYIILQSNDNVFFVDQHAAHERVMYEKYMTIKKPGQKPSDVEALLVPQIISVTAADYEFISSHINDFAENGFELELLDNREIALRSLPLGTRNKPAEVFEQIMNDLKREVPQNSALWYSLIQTTACKAAIRAGDVITKEEALSLIAQMVVLKDPYHCAHGRPTFFKIARKDFEKNFKRIV